MNANNIFTGSDSAYDFDLTIEGGVVHLMIEGGEIVGLTIDGGHTSATRHKGTTDQEKILRIKSLDDITESNTETKRNIDSSVITPYKDGVGWTKRKGKNGTFYKRNEETDEYSPIGQVVKLTPLYNTTIRIDENQLEQLMRGERIRVEDVELDGQNTPIYLSIPPAPRSFNGTYYPDWKVELIEDIERSLYRESVLAEDDDEEGGI